MEESKREGERERERVRDAIPYMLQAVRHLRDHGRNVQDADVGMGPATIIQVHGQGFHHGLHKGHMFHSQKSL